MRLLVKSAFPDAARRRECAYQQFTLILLALLAPLVLISNRNRFTDPREKMIPSCPRLPVDSRL
jgi:hypothetical protein